jgi:hypothetical protein
MTNTKIVKLIECIVPYLKTKPETAKLFDKPLDTEEDETVLFEGCRDTMTMAVVGSIQSEGEGTDWNFVSFAKEAYDFQYHLLKTPEAYIKAATAAGLGFFGDTYQSLKN